jgi:hypothetical protein
VVIGEDGEPISWNAAFIEVSNDTEIGATILIKLEGLGII